MDGEVVQQVAAALMAVAVMLGRAAATTTGQSVGQPEATRTLSAEVGLELSEARVVV